ncbi:hypothetical protein Bbelb_073820 [Branchiostoma belcheri]|nr:hypothetical protein Bbelb_073820 [Branchiostoma belcheri]
MLTDRVKEWTGHPLSHLTSLAENRPGWISLVDSLVAPTAGQTAMGPVRIDASLWERPDTRQVRQYLPRDRGRLSDTALDSATTLRRVKFGQETKNGGKDGVVLEDPTEDSFFRDVDSYRPGRSSLQFGPLLTSANSHLRPQRMI